MILPKIIGTNKIYVNTVKKKQTAPHYRIGPVDQLQSARSDPELHAADFFRREVEHEITCD